MMSCSATTELKWVMSYLYKEMVITVLSVENITKPMSVFLMPLLSSRSKRASKRTAIPAMAKGPITYPRMRSTNNKRGIVKVRIKLKVERSTRTIAKVETYNWAISKKARGMKVGREEIWKTKASRRNRLIKLKKMVTQNKLKKAMVKGLCWCLFTRSLPMESVISSKNVPSETIIRPSMGG